ncbi:DUF2975 domain-containing protein [Neobacillus mesonae]|nr:DUF2975 domain-containing protein [Neobacillus mesonae]
MLRANLYSELAVISLERIKGCAVIIIILYLIGMFFLAALNALYPGIVIF